MKLATLYKRATTGKITQWTIEIENNKYRTTSGYVDGAKTTTEWTVCEGKSIGRSNETTADQQALKDAKSLWDKKVEKGYFSDQSKVDNESYFKPMLANKWEDYSEDITYPIYSQPKLDGIRCIVKKDGMWTRNGKAIISAPHVYERLKPLLDKNPNLIFDGELYADKFANDFNAICSLVKKTKPTSDDLAKSKEQIQYHIYDLPSHGGKFIDRFNMLWSLNLPECCVRVRTDVCGDESIINDWYEDYVDWGYEGQMIRLDKEYESKRSKSLLKHKSFIDEEYTILDVIEGEGNKTGMVGSFEIGRAHV